MIFDTEKIKAEVSPMGIIEYLGRNYHKSGNSIFIECPAHRRELGKPDRHLSNCVLRNSFEEAFYCNSCHSSGDGFDMIAGYQDLDLKQDFREILTIAAEAGDGIEAYLLDKQKQAMKANHERMEEFRLSNEELAELNLKPNVYMTSFSAAYDESHIDEHDKLMKDINMFSLNENKLPRVSYLDSFNVVSRMNALNKETYIHLLKSRALSSMERYKQLILDEQLQEHDLFLNIPIRERLALVEGMKNTYRQKYIRVKTIYKKLINNGENLTLDDSWLYD